MTQDRFNIEFEGFYDSIHSTLIDDIASDLNINCEDVNYKETYNNYSKQYVNILNDILEINLIYIQLNSPRFYNYETDKIEVEINDNDFNKLSSIYLNDNEFINYVNESCKSYDGYISFYKNFNDVLKENEILLMYLFNYILSEYDQDIKEDLLFNNHIEIKTNK